MPSGRVESPAATEEKQIEQWRDCMKVLIADDHEVVRVGLQQILAKHTIIAATDGDSALKLFKKHKPDVTLLDVRMPHDGLACLARIKLENAGAPVLMLSGYDNPTYIARAVALGAQGYLLKTAPAKEILAAVKAVANGEDIWTRELLRRVGGSLSTSDKVAEFLTKREGEVLKLVAFGLGNREIAQALGISHETVKEHIQHIFGKVGVNDRTQLAVWAVRNALV
jgi:DNA-binding NarL/FixJ family response regulator